MSSELIQRALLEDGAFADITTLSTVPASQQAQAHILTRQAGVIAGLQVAAETFQTLDSRIEIQLLVEDGASVQPGDLLMQLSGPARSLLCACH
jgi:nicotinate-nucleotide pyrophosphorylase (carboxylating)